jgi:hypothetical protein
MFELSVIAWMKFPFEKRILGSVAEKLRPNGVHHTRSPQKMLPSAR